MNTFERLACSILCILVAAGCETSAVPASDVRAARQLLENSLQAWKAGRSVEHLRQQMPPVYVVEDLWTPSFQLLEYTIDSDGELYGSNVRLPVTLTGHGKNRETIRRQVKYLVTTTPALTVAREDR